MTKKKEKKKLKELNIAFIDTETTGLDTEQCEIIEIAAVIYNPNTGTIVREWSRKAAPRTIETAQEIALEMNGYNDDPESYQDNIEDVIREYAEVVEGCMIAGQNIQFDIGFIEKYYREFNIAKGVHRHRKLEISSLVWPVIRNSDADSLSLETLCNHFKISNENSHRALTDCQRTLEVYKCVMKIFEMTRMLTLKTNSNNT